MLINPLFVKCIYTVHGAVNKLLQLGIGAQNAAIVTSRPMPSNGNLLVYRSNVVCGYFN